MFSHLESVNTVENIPGKYCIEWFNEDGMRQIIYLQFVNSQYKKVSRGKKLPRNLFAQVCNLIRSKKFGKIAMGVQTNSGACANEHYQHVRGAC